MSEETARKAIKKESEPEMELPVTITPKSRQIYPLKKYQTSISSY